MINYMVYRNKILILLLLFIIGIVQLESCSREQNNGNFSETDDDKIRISIKIPTGKIPSTILKSGQIENESKINEIQVLVFENGLYRYKVRGEAITQTDNNASFLARLRSNSVPTTIYLIANNNAFINANEPAENTPIDNVKTLFNLEYSTTGVGGNAALWGSFTFENGIKSTFDTTEPIHLLRAVARADVQIEATASNFTLETVQVFRAANSIQIIPNSITPKLAVTAPSIPDGTLFAINTNPVNASSETFSTAQIYVPESPAPAPTDIVSNSTCIVIGGRYNNSSSTRYYRLDFEPDIDGHPFGQVLRNHRYIFSINSVNNSGFATAADAANNPSSGMEASLLVWNDNDILNIFFDKNNFFALEKLNVDLAGIINSSYQVRVATDVASYYMRFIDEPLTNPTSSLNDGTFSITQTDQGRTLVFTALRDNPADGEIRQRIIEIIANDIHFIRITVNQLPRMNIQWSMHNVNTFGDTTTTLNARGLLYQWNSPRGWNDMGTGTPSGWPTAVALSRSPIWEQSNNPCPQGWRLPFDIEFRELLAEFPGRREDRSTNPLIGEWFGRTQAEANAATFSNPGNCIFFPYSGRRRDNGTTVADNKINGFYWSQDVTLNANNEIAQINMLRMGQEFTISVHRQNINREALAIRCVKER